MHLVLVCFVLIQTQLAAALPALHACLTNCALDWCYLQVFLDALNNWQGVECDPDTGRVTSIDLSMPLCSANSPCPLPSDMFSVLSALHTFSGVGANL